MAWPFLSTRTLAIDQIDIWLYTYGVTGSKFRLGIYDNTSSTCLYPLNLIKDSGDVVGDGPPGVANIFLGSFPDFDPLVILNGGQLYWLCLMCNGNYIAVSGEVSDVFAVLASGGSLTPATTYFYIITATGAFGETQGQDNGHGGLAPAASAQTDAGGGTNFTINLTWDQFTGGSGATGYRIYRSTDPLVWTDTLIGTTTGLSSTSFSDTGYSPAPGTPPTGLPGSFGVNYNMPTILGIDPVTGYPMLGISVPFSYAAYPDPFPTGTQTPIEAPGPTPVVHAAKIF